MRHTFNTIISHVIVLSEQFILSASISETVKYIEDIYFLEVNTKYISSSVLKISVLSLVRIFDEIILVFTEKKSKFSFYFFR